MRKKTTWAASVVRKQLQTCCQHETLSLDTHEPDDISIESFELPSEVYISSPVKDPSTFPSLLRRKSFNVSHVRNLLTTPELQTPYRKSVDSSLPLCVGSTFKPRRLQYVRSSANLVPGDAATPEPRPLPLPSPPRLEASSTPKAKVFPKSGPLPMMRCSSFKEGSVLEVGSNSPVKLKKYLSGPLPSSLRKTPLTGSSPSPSPPPIKLITMSGKAKELRGGGPSPTNRFMRVKSSAQALFPTVATSKLPGMVTQGTLKKAAQLAKVTPVLERKGSRGSRASREGNSRATPVGKPPLVMGNGMSSPQIGRMRSNERERFRAAVKIQAAIRGYRARKQYAIDLARANNVSGELTDEEHEEAPSISTRMSRTNPPKRKPTARGSRVGMEQVSKSWNGSLRTAQDCQALLKSKQEAALKRERAMEYAMSRQNWKTGSRSQKSTTPASWVVDNTFPDKPGWVWNWLERAARMGAHNSPNRIFDNDFDNDFDNHEDPVSESLSVKSTVGVCTTELGSAGDMQHLAVPMTYPWPLSLRQQHAAGLLQPKKAPFTRPSPLKKSETSGAPEPNHGSELKTNAGKKSRRRHPSEAQEVCRSREDLSTTARSCVTSPMSDELSLTKPRFGVRKLKFTEDGALAEDAEKVMKEGGDGESVGSCVGPLPSQYRLSSPFAGPRPRTSSQSGLQQQQQQLRMSNPNSLRETMKVNPQAHGNSQSHHKQRHQVSVALSEDDSAGTTAASVRRPFWRP
ncbi:hypothetical protein M758_3G053400 [Ceratodon purpureus]|uniref:Uncharacterized protein n=1 Tax=Ceratodon purpureus TaxID=3225 RepID=A0A8T0IIT8_CERPU|nr:hypothetical protein KC19_3G055400 [Ceratodon purpureus]KAG0621860.1 hypothetical protein M758_3G053400 [Ceratodon purpureus]